MKDDRAFLLDMLLAARDARAFTESLDWRAFAPSRLHQNAVIYALAIIGEAANKLSPAYHAAHEDLPWREMIGMRHRLIHGYGEVRLDIVWNVIQRLLPELIAAIDCRNRAARAIGARRRGCFARVTLPSPEPASLFRSTSPCAS